MCFVIQPLNAVSRLSNGFFRIYRSWIGAQLIYLVVRVSANIHNFTHLIMTLNDVRKASFHQPGSSPSILLAWSNLTYATPYPQGRGGRGGAMMRYACWFPKSGKPTNFTDPPEPCDCDPYTGVANVQPIFPVGFLNTSISKACAEFAGKEWTNSTPAQAFLYQEGNGCRSAAHGPDCNVTLVSLSWNHVANQSQCPPPFTLTSKTCSSDFHSAISSKW